jgi:uncharacterized membrane protein YgcG
MRKWFVSFDGKWQGSFHDFDEAVEWAEEVAATGRTVDVAERRWLRGWKLVTAFPESARAGREAAWAAWTIPWLGGGAYVGMGGGGFEGGGGDGGGGGGC